MIKNTYHDTINKLSKVKDVFVKKEEPEILPKIIKKAAPVKDEGYVSPAKPKTSKEIVIATLTKVRDVTLEYVFKFIVVAFYIGLASLVANDMIIYAAPIRAFFFLFTLFFTFTVFPFAICVALYYLLKRGYDYYNKNLSSAKDKPPQTFPTIFAILPLTTYYPTSPFIRFFLWLFMYQKSDNPIRMEKENKRLEIIMSQYWNDLNRSFEYIDKIKDTQPFKDLYDNIKEKLTIEGMHPIQKPKIVIEPSKPLPEAEKKEIVAQPKIAPMPATISQTNNTTVQPVANSTMPATISQANSTANNKTVPATISQANTTVPENSTAPTKAPVPATISQANTTVPTKAPMPATISQANTTAPTKAPVPENTTAPTKAPVPPTI